MRHDPGALHRADAVVSRGPRPADAAVVVIAVHGRDQSPEYMLEHLVDPLARFGEVLDAERIAWLLPAATGGSWYPGRFQDPADRNWPHLDDALCLLHTLHADLADVPDRRIVWCGFSQGACLVAEFVARRPRRWGGLLAFTGGRFGPSGADLTIDGDLGGMPAYFGVGTGDEWVPVERVEETVAAFGRAGSVVTLDVFPDSEHEIRPDEIARAATIVAAAAGR